MNDQTAEIPTINPIEVIKVDPQERVNGYVYQGLINWINTDFRDKFCSLQGRRKDVTDTNWLREQARLMGQLGLVLDIFACDRKLMAKGEIGKINRELTEILFNTKNPESLINVKCKDNENSYSQLVSAVSYVTLTDLLRKCGQNVQTWELLPSSEMDVDYAADLVFRFKDKTIYGKEIIRLVQLKASSKVKKVEIYDIDSEKIRKNQEPKCNPREVEKMRRGMKNIVNEENSKGNQVVAKGFYVVVPTYYDIQNKEGKTNVFGIITNRELIDDFRYNSEAYGLIPQKF
jgi:hypothetical protein